MFYSTLAVETIYVIILLASSNLFYFLCDIYVIYQLLSSIFGYYSVKEIIFLYLKFH